MAARWRALGVKRPAHVAAFATTHQRLLDRLRRADRAQPDAICHDLAAREITAEWGDERMTVAVEGVGGPFADVRSAG